MYFSTGAQLQAALSALPTSKVGSYVAFDAFYYGATYMGAYSGTLTPIEHFVQIGAPRGYKPNADFDPVFYAEQYADLKGQGFDAADLLYHFMQYGLDEGRAQNISYLSFDGLAYLELYPDVKAYVEANLDQFGGSLTNGAIAHFVKFGEAEGRQSPGITTGETYTLTTGVDSIKITTANTVDTINGVVDGTTTANSTFSVGDLIEGNGKTVLRLAVADDGAAQFATVKNVDQVNLVAGVSGGLDVNALDWTGIGSVNLVSGMDGLQVDVDNLHAGVDLSVGSAVGGSITADYTDGRGAWIYSDRGSSISYTDGGNVVGMADAGGDAEFSTWATENGVALTVGDITLTAANNGDDGYAGVYNTQAKGGDITVGNVTITGFDEVDFYVSNTDHSSSATAVNTTVGDVTLAANKSGSLDMSIENTSDGKVGNLAVGNISIALAEAVTSADLFINNDGYGAAGELTVGNIDVSLGKSATGWMSISNDAWGAGAKKATTLGDSVIGNINLAMGQDSSFDLDIDHDVTATTADATMGNVTVGDVTATLGQNADLSIDLDASAYAVKGAMASIGNVSVGAMSFDLAVDASLDAEVSISAYNSAGAGASIGDVVIGDLDLNMGINTDASFEYDIYAYGTDEAKTSIQSVSFGNVNAAIDDGASLDYSVSLTSYGSLGDVSFGNLALTAGVSADASFDYSVWAETDIGNIGFGDIDLVAGQDASVDFSFDAYNSSGDVGNVNFGNLNIEAGVDADVYFSNSVTAYGDLGNVTFGDLTVAAAKSATVTVYNEISASEDMGNVTIGNVSLAAAENAYIWASHDFSAWDGQIGAVSVGDVSVSAGKNAYAGYGLYLEAETAIGAVTIGDVSISAVGVGASASVSIDIENDNVGTIGAVVVGDVSLTVEGDGAWGGFYISASSAASAGTVTVGDLDLSIGTDAKKTGSMDVSIGNDLGDVVIGDINLTGTSVRGTTDATMAYSLDLSVWADDDITIGNITVSGGDGVADNFNNLGFLSTSAGGDVTIGNVDYSGYGAAATIDVAGYKGAGAVIGTAFGDTITDNAGKNTLTGGAGADTFVLLNANTGKTLATMDVIADFNNAAGDKIDLSLSGGVLTVGRYGEASYADFDAFVAGADAGNKAVFVGQIGSDSIVAVDHNEDGTVDFMVMLTGVSTANIDVASFV